MAVLAVERLSATELAALAAYEQAEALNEVLADLADVSRRATAARIAHASVRKSLLTVDRQDTTAVAALKCAEIDAKVTLDNLRDRARSLREYKSILQTFLRAIPA